MAKKMNGKNKNNAIIMLTISHINMKMIVYFRSINALI